MLFYENLEAYVAGECTKLEHMRAAAIPEQGVILKVLAADPLKTIVKHPASYSITREVSGLFVDAQGILDDRHYGLYHQSGGRERQSYPRGTTIVQRRHVFAVSLHDCALLSERLGAEVTPELLGANIVIAREDGKFYLLSAVPPGTHFFIASSDAESKPRLPIATLVHYVRQQGCGITGLAIAAAQEGGFMSKVLEGASIPARFIDISKEYRGIVCSVEYPVEQPALLEAGQQIYFRFPMHVAP